MVARFVIANLKMLVIILISTNDRRGPFVTALDKTWCPEHFVCANPNCSQPLFDCGFVEEADQLYCEKDYEKYLAPRCARCSGSIVGVSPTRADTFTLFIIQLVIYYLLVIYFIIILDFEHFKIFI